MKIVIDSAIPFIEGLFEPFAEVLYRQGAAISKDDVIDADALIIRTRTRCDESLLEGSKVRHIATATIGYDHIDLAYCTANNIEVTTAAGCNARGVLQWVAAALVEICKNSKFQEQPTIGVVGVGNVGRLVEKYAKLWGFNVTCCDPPRAEKEAQTELGSAFTTFEELLPQVDILTFHTPLDKTTHHLLNSKNITLLKDSAAIINTSRGEVIESQALLNFANKNKSINSNPKLYLDVWENEPNIDRELLQISTASTPHIAGYSLQGKANGTAIVARDIARKFNLPIVDWYPNIEKINERNIEWIELQQTITQHFDIERESVALKESPDTFESMRNSYNYRNEYF
ncbi:MAG: 4-phosphoerythronate dehydrogenase [Rikenellaceae bacterium]